MQIRDNVTICRNHNINAGQGAPAADIGQSGDFYIDTAAQVIYGPKVAGEWPSIGTLLNGLRAALGITAKITVGTTPPENPAVGDIWIDTN